MADSESDEIDPKAPKTVSVDNQTVSGHSLKDQMDATDRANSKKSVKRKGFGLRRGRFIPGDAV